MELSSAIYISSLILFMMLYMRLVTNFYKSRSAVICDALRDLVPFVQFKKGEKQLWRSVSVGGGSTLTVLMPNSDQYWVKDIYVWSFQNWLLAILNFLVDINFTDQDGHRPEFQLEIPFKFKTYLISWISDLTMAYLVQILTIERISSQNLK